MVKWKVNNKCVTVLSVLDRINCMSIGSKSFWSELFPDKSKPIKSSPKPVRQYASDLKHHSGAKKRKATIWPLLNHNLQSALTRKKRSIWSYQSIVQTALFSCFDLFSQEMIFLISDDISVKDR